MATRTIRDDEARPEDFFAVSPLMIFPKTLGRFKVYIRQAGRYMLYAGENEQFTPRHRQKLHDNGVTSVYIRVEQRHDFERYIERNLPQILVDANISVAERSKVFYAASVTVVRDVFDNRLPSGLGKREYARIAAFVEKSVEFLATDSSLKQISSLLSHDYTVYTHCVQVFVYTTAILQSLRADDYTLVQAGIGALLHDLGKMRIPRTILNKPGPLTEEERRIINTHPVKGLALCRDMPLTQTAGHCLLLHHEKLSGQGYPGGLAGEEIPLYVRALSAADVYDALTTRRPYAEAMTPFEALRVMRDEMQGAFDLDIYKRLVMILSGANLV